MKAILLVTWIVHGQAISSYQVPFSTMALCRDAREFVMGDAARLNNEAAPKTLPAPNQVSAVCVFQ
jgi:hypothetical protein